MLGVDFKWQKADERSRLPDNKRKQKHLQTSDLVTLDAETYHCASRRYSIRLNLDRVCWSDPLRDSTRWRISDKAGCGSVSETAARSTSTLPMQPYLDGWLTDSWGEALLLRLHLSFLFHFLLCCLFCWTILITVYFYPFPSAEALWIHRHWTLIGLMVVVYLNYLPPSMRVAVFMSTALGRPPPRPVIYRGTCLL